MPDDDDDDHGDPRDRPPTPPSKPPLLDYPSRPAEPELDSERWSEVARALLIIFGIIGTLFFIVFGLCGTMLRGCG